MRVTVQYVHKWARCLVVFVDVMCGAALLQTVCCAACGSMLYAAYASFLSCGCHASHASELHVHVVGLMKHFHCCSPPLGPPPVSPRHHVNTVSTPPPLCPHSHLALSMNNLTKLPDSVGTLATLKHLEVSDNRLQTLPMALGN
jgi:hypothetical protein